METAAEDDRYEEDLERFIQIFNDLFTTPSFSQPALTHIILTNPTISLPAALATSTWGVAYHRPPDIEQHLSTLQEVLSSAEIRGVEVTGGIDGPELFVDEYERNLAEIISGNLYISDSTSASIDADSILLTTVLLQCVAVKVGIAETVDHVRIAREALRLPGSDPAPRDPEEGMAVATLIVFSSLGAEQAATALVREGGSYGDVLASLKGLKQRNVLAYSPAASLLERTITEVEARATESRTSEEIWESLFP